MRMCTEGWQEKMQDSFLVLHFSQGPLIVSDLFNGELSTERDMQTERGREKNTRKTVALFLSGSFVISTVSHHRNERFCDRTALMTELSLRCFPLCLPLFKSVRFLFLF